MALSWNQAPYFVGSNAVRVTEPSVILPFPSSCRASFDKPPQLYLKGRFASRLEKSRKRRAESRGTGANGPLLIDGMPIGEEKLLQKIFWLFGRWLYETWFDQETFCADQLPLHRGTFLLASNHSSHLDCGAVYIAAWAAGVQKVYALGARDYFFCHPLLAWFVTRFMRVIPFNRRGFSQREVEILQRIKEASSPSSSAAILIFPEGTRSKDGNLRKFKAGVSFLAEKLDIPVVPVCVKGTLYALPKGRTIPHRYKVKVMFGPCLEMKSYLEDTSNGESDASLPGVTNSCTTLPSLAPEKEAEQHGEPAGTLSASIVQGAAGAGLKSEPECRSEAPSTSTQGSASGDLDKKAPLLAAELAADRLKARRRAAQTHLLQDLEAGIAAMLGEYNRDPLVVADERHRVIAERLGGGVWRLVGWLGYWVPLVGMLIAAVGMAGAESWKAGVSKQGYATAASVFRSLRGAGGVQVLLSIAVIALFFRTVLQWLWPVLIMAAEPSDGW